ncbi:MAG: hypothetical protein QXV17_07610 [Candidatus Micrarchaeaceae archaeon]
MTFKGMTTSELLKLYENTKSIGVRKDLLEYVEKQLSFFQSRLAKTNASRYTMRRYRIVNSINEYEILQQYFSKHLLDVVNDN